MSWSISPSSQSIPSLHGGIHLSREIQIARPFEYLADRQDELRGLLGISWIRHRCVGRDLVHDPAVAVHLVRLVPQQPQRLLGQLEIAGRRERLHGVRLGSEPPRIFHEAAAETATDAGNVPDQPLHVDPAPVVDLLQALVRDSHAGPVDDRAIVRRLLRQESDMVLSQIVVDRNGVALAGGRA